MSFIKGVMTEWRGSQDAPPPNIVQQSVVKQSVVKHAVMLMVREKHTWQK